MPLLHFGVHPVLLLCFSLTVACHSRDCLLQLNATHHSVEPCNEQDHNRPALSLLVRETFLTKIHPAPVGQGKAPAEQAAATKDVTEHLTIIGALRVELSMPTTIRAIHESPQGPLSQFLLELQLQICKSAKVPPKRLSLLSIRGEYTRLETMLMDSSTLDGKRDIRLVEHKQNSYVADRNIIFPALYPDPTNPQSAALAGTPAPNADSSPSTPDPALASPDHEVLIDMEILPAVNSSVLPVSEIYAKIKNSLKDSQSLLRTGPLGKMLTDSQLTIGKKPSIQDANAQKHSKSKAMGVLPSITILLILTFLWHIFE